MVQHRHADSARESIAFQARCCCVCANDVDGRAGEPLLERRRKIGIDLYCGEVVGVASEHIRRESRSGANLYNIVAKDHRIQDPWDDPAFDGLCPLSARTQRQVCSIHVLVLAVSVFLVKGSLRLDASPLSKLARQSPGRVTSTRTDGEPTNEVRREHPAVTLGDHDAPGDQRFLWSRCRPSYSIQRMTTCVLHEASRRCWSTASPSENFVMNKNRRRRRVDLRRP